MPKEKPGRNSLIEFFSNPVVGIIGSIASVVGVFLGIYFYLGSRLLPELTYRVQPLKAIVVKSNQASKLTISFDNKVIRSDITASQVALWNNGKLAIKKQNILKPIVVYTEKNTPILEASIINTSRDVTQIVLGTEELQKGALRFCGTSLNIMMVV